MAGEIVTETGGTVRDGESFTISYSLGGLTGTTGCTIGGVACTGYSVTNDTTATATAPASGLNHTGSYTLSVT